MSRDSNVSNNKREMTDIGGSCAGQPKRVINAKGEDLSVIFTTYIN